MTAKTEKYDVPEVYTALLAILAELSVAKNGTLPSNMGGKPYLTAVDVARETKTLFVQHDLIIVPNERIHNHETITHKDRINVLISIEGEYRIVSTRDGSDVTITGVGDGLAGGTAVASNIASTNALKNALLRTFLITEQSVEDAAKSGPSEPRPSATSHKLEQARAATAPAGDRVKEIQAKIREAIASGAVEKDVVNAEMTRLKSESGLSGEALQEALAKFAGVEV